MVEFKFRHRSPSAVSLTGGAYLIHGVASVATLDLVAFLAAVVAAVLAPLLLLPGKRLRFGLLSPRSLVKRFRCDLRRLPVACLHCALRRSFVHLERSAPGGL